MKSYLVIYSFLVLSFLSCESNPKSVSIEEELINKCIDAHGGMDKWRTLPSIIYSKSIVLFNSEGLIEKKFDQIHNYKLLPKLSGTMKWTDSIDRRITYQDEIAYKLNGNKKEEPSQSALNTFNSAYYVLNMPWKLKDSSAVISYQGLDTILENRIVHKLKVEYPSINQSDIWEYYLDQKEYYLVANKVYHGSTISLITNDEFAMHKGLKFNAKRTSYMVDSLGDILYLRAKYIYEFDG